MRAVRFHAFGNPQEVLVVEDIPLPEIADDEVLVRLTARSVNPSDLYTVMGVYGLLPTLPAVPGNEAAGVIERVGAHVTTYAVGDRVILLLGAVGLDGTWKEYAAVKPQFLLPTPASLTDEQAACTWVNYLTAWILAFEELNLQRDEPVLATAGASHLGRALLQLSQHAGFKVVPVVRRTEQKQELMDLGALGVIAMDSDDLEKEWTAITGRKGVHKALEAVGGEIGSAVAGALAPRGTMIIYGLMSLQPWTIDGRIVFSEALVRGFWLVTWLQLHTPEHVASIVQKLSALFADGTLKPEIDSTFDLTDIQGMLTRSNEAGRHGKVILTGPRS